jgi:hypothetical protein
MIFKQKPAWSTWVTPKALRDLPIHRWYVFPHSFSPQLAHELIDDWKLDEADCILDPFAGAGTTLLAAREKGIRACGYDLSPLAVLASHVKTTNYKTSRLEKAWFELSRNLAPLKLNGLSRDYPSLVKGALPGKLLSGFDSISSTITKLSCSPSERDFFRLALLSTLPAYSRAVATGGWLKWVDAKTRVTSLVKSFRACTEIMLLDCRAAAPSRPRCQVAMADARRLPDQTRKYSAVITSPPYPNRHDYTRVFGVELMLSLLDWEQTRALRYQSFSSHPESRPIRPRSTAYDTPASLTRVLALIRRTSCDERIPEMLEGYFLDMYLCLRELKRVCRSGARIAFVVGNARYAGHSILVDKLTAEVGEQAGLTCKKLMIARYRGNSAQQMGKFGRKRSRETVVLFERP